MKKQICNNVCLVTWKLGGKGWYKKNNSTDPNSNFASIFGPKFVIQNAFYNKAEKTWSFKILYLIQDMKSIFECVF